MAHQIATSDSVKQLFQSQLLLTTSLEFFSQLIPHYKNEIICTCVDLELIIVTFLFTPVKMVAHNQQQSK